MPSLVPQHVDNVTKRIAEQQDGQEVHCICHHLSFHYVDIHQVTLRLDRIGKLTSPSDLDRLRVILSMGVTLATRRNRGDLALVARQ